MKKLFKFITVFIFIIILSGCIKLNVTMDIKKDKSMDIGYLTAVLESLMENTNGKSIIDEEAIEEKRKQGFTVTPYSDNSYVGYKLSKHINNIDKYSTTNSVVADLSVDNKKENEYLFSVQRGLFKNKYTAVFVFNDVSNMNNNQLNDTNNFNEDQFLEEDDDTILDPSYLETMQNSFDCSFIVNLPNKVLNNNATSVSEDGKKLTWNLTKLTDKDNISFTFELYNMTIIYITGSVALLCLIGFAFLVVKKLKKIKQSKLNMIINPSSYVAPEVPQMPTNVQNNDTVEQTLDTKNIETKIEGPQGFTQTLDEYKQQNNIK